MPNPEITTYWLPAEWADEMVPGLLDSPDAYITQPESGVWQLRLPDNDPEYENDFFRLELQPGKVVQWLQCERYGDRTLTVAEDRSFTLSAPIPAKANCFWLPMDIDTLQSSLEELVHGGDLYGEPLETGEHLVEGYWWSEQSTALRFVIEDGRGRFVPTAGEH